MYTCITKIVFKVTIVECLLINDVTITDDFQLMNLKKKIMRMVKNLLNTPTTQNRKNNGKMGVRSIK